MLNREQKREVVEELSKRFSKDGFNIFIDFQGLKNEELQDLRKELKKRGIDFKVAKKTLLKLALKKKKIDFDPLTLQGEIAVAFGKKDEIIPAKILYNWSLQNENLKILKGIYKGKEISRDSLIELAKLPPKEELLARLIGSISNPMSGLVNVLEGNIKGLIFALRAIKK